jgi:hypothetical protein
VNRDDTTSVLIVGAVAVAGYFLYKKTTAVGTAIASTAAAASLGLSDAAWNLLNPTDGSGASVSAPSTWTQDSAGNTYAPSIWQMTSSDAATQGTPIPLAQAQALIATGNWSWGTNPAMPTFIDRIFPLDYTTYT